MEFLVALNILLIPRLFVFLNDRPLTSNAVIALGLSQAIGFGIIFQLNATCLLLILSVVILNLFFAALERLSKALNRLRFFSLLLAMLLLGFFASASMSLALNRSLLSGLLNLDRFLSPLTVLRNTNWFAFNCVSAGILLLLNEVNLLIRWLFEKFSLVPMMNVQGKSTRIDQHELNAGRIIGMLERVLIFFFVLIGEFAAIGFIIAAKGFTRFKELDDRAFAEYVLIGTLLSSALALVIGTTVRYALAP